MYLVPQPQPGLGYQQPPQQQQPTSHHGHAMMMAVTDQPPNQQQQQHQPHQIMMMASDHPHQRRSVLMTPSPFRSVRTNNSACYNCQQAPGATAAIAPKSMTQKKLEQQLMNVRGSIECLIEMEKHLAEELAKLGGGAETCAHESTTTTTTASPVIVAPLENVNNKKWPADQTSTTTKPDVVVVVGPAQTPVAASATLTDTKAAAAAAVAPSAPAKSSSVSVEIKMPAVVAAAPATQTPPVPSQQQKTAPPILLQGAPEDYKFLAYEGNPSSKVAHEMYLKDKNLGVFADEMALYTIRRVWHFLQRNIWNIPKHKGDVMIGSKTAMLTQFCELFMLKMLQGINTQGKVALNDFRVIQKIVARNTTAVPFEDRYEWAQTELWSYEGSRDEYEWLRTWVVRPAAEK